MSDRFDITDTSIEGLKLIRRKPIGDKRGYLERLFCAEEFRNFLPACKQIHQINRTLTASKGTVRGMHFQYPPNAETKIVSCLAGEVYDVAVDLRQGSPTFLQWCGQVLSSENHMTFMIPEGFAHGFQVLAENTEMLYFHTASYQPLAEGALNALDPALDIKWPRRVAGLSERDKAHPMLNGSFDGISI